MEKIQDTQVVILAAGLGSRLKRREPKALTRLSDGRTILQQQLDNIETAFGWAAKVSIVVGYKADSIIEAHPHLRAVQNPLFEETNTAKSLLLALQHARRGGVLWMNGDVVFSPFILERALPLMAADQSFVVANRAKVGEEEVKYLTDGDGHLRELSKTVASAEGEAVGINFISAADKPLLVHHLARAGAQDYFEKGIESAVQGDGLEVAVVDTSDLYAVEVDFSSDLEAANGFLAPTALYSS